MYEEEVRRETLAFEQQVFIHSHVDCTRPTAVSMLVVVAWFVICGRTAVSIVNTAVFPGAVAAAVAARI